MNKNRLFLGILNTITAILNTITAISLMFVILISFMRLSNFVILFSISLVALNLICAVYNFRICKEEE